MHDIKSTVFAAAVSVALIAAAPSTGAAGHHMPGHAQSLGICSVETSRVSIPHYDGLSGVPAHSTVAWNYACRPVAGGGPVTPQNFTVQDTQGGDGDVHYMTDGRGHRLAYFLCVDPGCSMPVSQGIGNLDALVQTSRASAGASVAGTLLLYVLVPARQRVPVGDYSDTLTVDVQY